MKKKSLFTYPFLSVLFLFALCFSWYECQATKERLPKETFCYVQTKDNTTTEIPCQIEQWSEEIKQAYQIYTKENN